MLAMTHTAQQSSSVPLNRVVESFNRIAKPLADYALERFPGIRESHDASSKTYPGICSGYRGSVPMPEQRKTFAAQIIRVLGA